MQPTRALPSEAAHARLRAADCQVVGQTCAAGAGPMLNGYRRKVNN